MQLLRVTTQFKNGEITKGVIPLRDNTTSINAVRSWAGLCHNAGVHIAYIQYSSEGVWKSPIWIQEELKIKLNNY